MPQISPINWIILTLLFPSILSIIYSILSSNSSKFISNNSNTETLSLNNW